MEVFSRTLELASRYASLLCAEGVERGLIGPREAPRIWTRHLINCAVATEGVPMDARVADVGSGAGLPGLVWAIRRPDLRVTLIEPLLRRANFLAECVDLLGLSERVLVERVRAEDAADVGEFDVVSSRAVAPLKRLVPWCAPLCRQGGMILALKGTSVEDEIRSARAAISRVATGGARTSTYGRGLVEVPTTGVEIEVDRPARPAGRR